MTCETTSRSHDETTGILYAGSAYAFWGFMPLYWRMLGDVPPFELTVHRVLWCALFLVAVTFFLGNSRRAISIFRSWRLVGILSLTSLLISCNWTLFIWCVATNQLVDASLGYYMTPLVSFAAGIAFFGERLSRLRIICVVLAVIAVVIQTVGVGHISWIGPALALSFGLYGYLRKLAPVAALDGLLVETMLLFPITLGLVGFWMIRGIGAFPSPNLLKDALLVCGGPLTAVPLALFSAGARRIRLTTLGFLQYASPSITLLLAVFGFHEPFTRVNAIAFGFVWTALAIVALEGRVSWLRQRPAQS
jgi:chloramphenicol-sensitive protein RarD